MTEPIHKMTTIIEFKRQLWPQPPKDASPSFYLINTLGFRKDGEIDYVEYLCVFLHAYYFAILGAIFSNFVW